MQQLLAATPQTQPPAGPARRRAACPPARSGTRVFAGLAKASGILVLVLLGAIIVMLFVGGLPAFRAFGLGFLTSTRWDPAHDIYGAVIPIYGTVVSAVLAMVLSVPLAFGIAFFLTEIAPQWMRRPGRHRRRAAGGRAVHHLRHVGLLRHRAGHVRLRAALGAGHASATSRASACCSAARPTAPAS